MNTTPPSQPPVSPSYVIPRFHIYTALVTVFASLIVISNVCATKGVMYFPNLHLKLGFLELQGISTDGAFWLFPLSYVIGDVISEVYGFKAMRRAVWLGFLISALGAVAFAISVALPAADFYPNQEAFKTVLGVVPQILLGSLTGFVLGELTNAFVLVRMKAKSGESGLFGRLWLSSLAGQLVDTVAFCAIAAPVIGITDMKTFINYTVFGFLWKLLVETVMMPFTMGIIAAVKKYEADQYQPLSPATAQTPVA